MKGLDTKVGYDPRSKGPEKADSRSYLAGGGLLPVSSGASVRDFGVLGLRI